jgi:hypothetical protein
MAGARCRASAYRNPLRVSGVISGGNYGGMEPWWSSVGFCYKFEIPPREDLNLGAKLYPSLDQS